MEKIAIVGGGIVGMTLANYLDTKKFQVTLYDESTGQGTKASAGIISPWLSKRRNKQWYALAKDGAAFLPKLIQDLGINETIYQQSGTLLFREPKQLDDLEELAHERRKDAPEIGEITRLTPEQTTEEFSLLAPRESLKISGGGRLDGQAYLAHTAQRATARGVVFVNESVTLKDTQTLCTSAGEQTFDRILLTPGPHLNELLAPLGVHVDLLPQKGQLLVFQTTLQASGHFPVAMLDGEADLIPFNDGKIILGATHENNAGWDLKPTKEAFEQLTNGVRPFLADPTVLDTENSHFRVGTRAYTSDFSPFFGHFTEQLLVASGLGSSGLTTGPYIGYQLAHFLNTGEQHWMKYQKELSLYLKEQQKTRSF